MQGVEIVDLGKIDLAVVEHIGDYQGIKQAFSKLFAFAGPNNLIDENTRIFGLYYDDPSVVELDKLRSKAAISVSKDFEEGELKRDSIMPGKYAKFIHKGPYTELPNTYDWIFSTWFENSNEDYIKGSACIEEYIDDPQKVEASQVRTAIYVALV